MRQRTYPDTSVHEIIQAIDVCLKDLSYLNALFWIFGISPRDIPNHIALWEKFLQQREEYHRMVVLGKQQGKKAVITNAADILKGYNEISKGININKEMWKNGPLKVLCSDGKLIPIASKVKERGFVAFTKDEFQKHFDISRVVEFWDGVPSYTIFFLGRGLTVSSPEFDLFEAMCWFHDEALRTHQELRRHQNRIGSAEFDEADYKNILAMHFIMCRQTLINSFLLVEAFLNSLADVHLSDPRKTITDEEKLYLGEKTKDSAGKLRQKFVSIQDKLHDWVRIISPRGETFDKGKNPYQTFLKIKKYRDSLVHLSAQKVSSFRSIDFDVAMKSVDTAIEIIERISEFVSLKPSATQYPFWLKRREDDGMFHVSRKLKLQLKDTV